MVGVVGLQAEAILTVLGLLGSKCSMSSSRCV